MGGVQTCLGRQRHQSMRATQREGEDGYHPRVEDMVTVVEVEHMTCVTVAAEDVAVSQLLDMDNVMSPSTVVDLVPEFVSDAEVTAEEVWRALQATRREGEDHPRVEDMVREVERMTGVAAEDVAAEELLDMALNFTRSPPPPSLLRIAQLVLERELPPLSEDGSLDWRGYAGMFMPHSAINMWRVAAVVCLQMRLVLAARRTARRNGTPWVDSPMQQALGPATLDAPLNYSSVRALATAFIAHLNHRSDDLHLFVWWGRPVREEVTEKEVEILYDRLARNHSTTGLGLPILLRRAGPGGPWGLDVVHCRHLCHMLSQNSKFERLELRAYSTSDHDGAGGGSTLGEEGDDGDAMDVDAGSVAPQPPQLLSSSSTPPVAHSWSNSTLQALDCVIYYDDASDGDDGSDRFCVQADEAFEVIAHLHALQKLAIRSGSGRVHLEFDWSSSKGLHLFKGMLTSPASRLKELLLPQVVGNPLTLVHCLSQNRGTLQKLELCLDVHGRALLFKLLTPELASQTTARAPITKSLRHLILDGWQESGKDPEHSTKEEVVALVSMFKSNTTLLTVRLSGATYLAGQWATKIFGAVEGNSKLEELDVDGSPGVDPDHVYEAMLNMLQGNTILRKIGLQGTPLQLQGKGAAIEAQLKRNTDYRDALNGLPTMPVKSCRLILCGYQLAGKTTLCDAICESAKSSVPSQQGETSTVDAANASEEVTNSRTRGFEVKLLEDHDNMRINVWDFAGQPHYYALHDFVFPSVNSSSLFLLFYSPVLHPDDPDNNTSQFQFKGSHDFERELTYWLKFIASNSRSESEQLSKPSVLVAITFSDVMSQKVESDADFWKTELIIEYGKLKGEFQRYIDVQGEEPHFLDARSPTDALKMLEHVRESLSNIVRQLPKVPRVCEKVRLALQDWCRDHPNQPIMTIGEFKKVFGSCASPHDGNVSDLRRAQSLAQFIAELPSGWRRENALSLQGQLLEHDSGLQKADAQLRDNDFFAHPTSWQVVGYNLADTGEIIYFKNMDFIVVSPHWLGRGVLGEILEAFTPGINSSSATSPTKFGDKGHVDKRLWQKLLESSLEKVGMQQQMVNATQLCQLMLNLHLCYEIRTKNNVKKGYVAPVLYFVPKYLNVFGSSDGLDDMQRSWLSQVEDSVKCFFTGLRLQCSNACTFLTPGFFPRLQVVLYEYYSEQEFIGPGKPKSLVKMDVDLFAVTTGGYDILVEYSGSTGFYVDVLTRSVCHPIRTMDFLSEHVVKPIRNFCASQEGCKGVSLEEHALRQECVKRLTNRRYRREQSVGALDLMRRVKKADGAYYSQTWPEVGAIGGMPNVLETRKEYATVVDGHVILGSKDDVDWASSDYVPEVLDDCYPDTNVKCGKRRGVAVLISMEKYKDKPRRGESVDRDKLEDLAASLKLDMVKFVDVSAGELEDELWNIARARITEDDECVVCFVGGHGTTFNDGAFYLMDTDDNWIALIDGIVTPFGKCKNLKGKPKIFFVTACRGNVKLRGTSETVVDALDETGIGDQLQIALPLSEGAKSRVVWEVADRLIVFSASPGAASIRFTESGSTFVDALVRNVNEKRDSKHLLDIVIRMTYDVSSIEVDYTDPSSQEAMKISQCPEVNHTLTKSIYWRSA